MTLIVETGVGLSTAESYLSVADANAYHAAHGNTGWTDDNDDDQEAALRRATAYLDGRYRNRWRGWRTHGRSQALEWPRLNVYVSGPNDGESYPGYMGLPYRGWPLANTSVASNEIPREIKSATAEAALREFLTPGSLTPDVTLTDRIKSETIGPISTTYADAPYSAAANRPVLTILDDLLVNLLRPMSMRLVRG